MSDNGAGVNRALRDIQDSHYRHTGALWMDTIKLVIDKSGIFKKFEQKLEALCYLMLWGSMFLCMSQLFYMWCNMKQAIILGLIIIPWEIPVLFAITTLITLL